MKVAVLIPTFNGASTIVDTLNSLQECRKLESISAVYLADDASSDLTIEVAEKGWSSKTPLKIIRHEKNNGIWINKNRAADTLKEDGVDWMILLHHDDIVKPEWLELLCDHISKADDRVISISTSWDVQNIDGTITVGEEKPLEKPLKIAGNPKTVSSTLQKGGWWHISGAAIRLQAFLDLGGFDPRYAYAADIDWTCRVLDAGWWIEFIPCSPIIFRRHPKTLSLATMRYDLDLREELEIHYRFSHYLGFVGYFQIQLRCLYFAFRRIGRALLRRDIQKFKTSGQTFIIAVGYLWRKRRKIAIL